jgi:sugar/nucleoside kinase (ribokinase family)
MSRRTLSIGGATYDVFLKTQKDLLPLDEKGTEVRLPLGGKIRVGDIVETCGGGAMNTSVGLKRLGCDAGFCGVLASDPWGETLQKNLKNEGVDMTGVTVVEGESSSFSMILLAGSDRIIFYNPGTNSHLHDANFERDALKDVDWIYLNRIHEGSCMIENDIIEALSREKAPGLTWNPGGSHIEQGMNVADTKRLLSYTRLLLLNKEEALTFTKSQKVEDAVEKLLQAGVVICCITDGRHGARVWTRTEAWHCPGITTTHIEDTTGAGDAFGTAATWALLQGFDLPTMLRAGTINATSVLGSIGAEKGLLTDTEMHTRLKTLHLPVEPFSR